MNHRRSPVAFFAIVFALSIPFWLLGEASGAQLLPGLPIAALGVVCPLAAALILALYGDGIAGAAVLLQRSFDIAQTTKRFWYLPALLTVPAVSVLAYLIQRQMGVAVPPLQISLFGTVALSTFFFAGAFAEELGWSGYALDPLQNRFGSVGAGLVLGVVCAAWHFVPLLQAHRALDWIGWWALGTVSTRVIMVWLYNRAGKSVFAMVLYHASSNLAWQLYPVHGSYYDPRLMGVLLALVALGVAFVGEQRRTA